jgi:glycosyltransferase involved in cell wall biosynthesis
MSKDQKKILISINTSWNIYNFRLNLLAFLQKKGYQIIALAPKDDYSKELENQGIIFDPLRIDNKGNNPIKDLALTKQYYRLLKKHRPDVALFYTIKPNIYGTIAAKRLGIPVINNVSGLGTAFIRTNWISKIAQRLYKQAFKSSHKVFFQNKDDRDLFIKHELVDEIKTGILPGSGVDLEKFNPLPLPTDLHFLYIGRLIYDKGIVEFLDSCKAIKEKQKENVKFSIIGKIETEAQLGITADKLKEYTNKGIIDYLGTTDNIKDEIEKASIIVLPSYREGTPRTLLEGAAMARPLLTTNVPGCKDLVKENYNGWLCEAKSTVDLTLTIEKIIQTDKKKLLEFASNSRTFVELNYDERLVFELYDKAISDIL